MGKNSLTKQLLAFLAATVIVFTAIYIFVLWRNQSADRVFQTQAGHLVYQTSDVAIGLQSQANQPDKVTLLRFSMEGGWSIAGTNHWLNSPQIAKYTNITLIDNQSSGAAGSVWLCALQNDPKLTAIQIYHSTNPAKSDTFDFHHGGIVEPVVVTNGMILRGYEGNHLVFSFQLQNALPH